MTLVTLRILGLHNLDLQLRLGFDRLLQECNRVGLVVLNGKYARFGFERVHQNLKTFNNALTALQKQAVVCGDVGLAFGTVDDNRVYLAERTLDFCIGRERSTAKAADTRLAYDIDNLLGGRLGERCGARTNALVLNAQAVVFDDDVLNGHSLRVVTGNDLLDRSRNTCMNGTTQSRLDLTDDLTDLNVVALPYNRLCVRTDVLRKRDGNGGRLGQTNGLQAGSFFVLRYVRAATKGVFFLFKHNDPSLFVL